MKNSTQILNFISFANDITVKSNGISMNETKERKVQVKVIRNVKKFIMINLSQYKSRAHIAGKKDECLDDLRTEFLLFFHLIPIKLFFIMIFLLNKPRVILRKSEDRHAKI